AAVGPLQLQLGARAVHHVPRGAGDGDPEAVLGAKDALVQTPPGAAGEDTEGHGRDERRAPGAGAHGLRSRSRALLVPARELLEDVAERDAALPEQHQRVEPEIGDLRDDPRIALAAECRRHHLRRLLADLAAHRGLALGEQARDVRARRRRRLALLHDALDALEHVGRRARTRQRIEEARARAGVAGHALLVDLDDEGVDVAVGVDALHVLHVTRRLALL